MKNTPYDVIFVLPYPFSDHPSFPEGILYRALEADGFRVGVLDAPHWQDPEEFKRLGRPGLFFALVPGPVDSVIMNYTPTRKRRKEDLYQLDGSAYFPGSPPSVASRVRPDRCVITFANQIRKAWKDCIVIAGGMETSQRIFAHYDFQQQRIRRSILLDGRLDLAVAGMGEIQIVNAARSMAAGIAPSAIDLPGTAVVRSQRPAGSGWVELPGYEEVNENPACLMTAYREQKKAAASGSGTFQRHADRWVIRYPSPVLSTTLLNEINERPYTRTHLFRKDAAMSPALSMNLFSVTSHRGCFGRCAFCSVYCHQGGQVVSRSEESILKEVSSMSNHPRWRGVVADLGGATAEMYGMERPDSAAETPYLGLLKLVSRQPRVRKVFVASGVRHDLMLRHPELLEEIMRHHSGRFLRVAPEHVHDDVLSLMGKPDFGRFRAFCELFASINRGLKRKVELAAYVIIGHPGEEDHHIRNMVSELRNLGVDRVDAQIFTPAPGLLSTAMFVSGVDSRGRPISVCREPRALQARKARLYAKKQGGFFT